MFEVLSSVLRTGNVCRYLVLHGCVMLCSRCNAVVLDAVGNKLMFVVAMCHAAH